MPKRRKRRSTSSGNGLPLFRDVIVPEWLKDTEGRKLPDVIGRTMIIEKFETRIGSDNSKFKRKKSKKGAKGFKAGIDDNTYAIVRAVEWVKGKKGKAFRFSISSNLVIKQLKQVTDNMPLLATLEKLPHPSEKGHTYYTLR